MGGKAGATLGGAGVPIIALRGGITAGGSEPGFEGRGAFFGGKREGCGASWGVNAVGVGIFANCTDSSEAGAVVGDCAIPVRSSLWNSSCIGVMAVP
jgi:hypothetical protein